MLKEGFISLNDFILQNCIGKGSYSKVYKVKEKSTNEIYAAKVTIQAINYNSNDQLMNLSREVNIISKLNHPSVLKFKGYSPIDFKQRLKPVIITEYASNGTLEDLILSERNSKSQTIFNDTQKLIIIYGIATAMQYLHSHNIIHRDLKPANILIDSFLFPKIADFGLSKIKISNIESMAVKSIAGSIKGTPIYMSPEIWSRSEYGKASDVYAFAIIVYEIMTNKKPFDGFHFFQIPIKVKEGYRPEFEKKIPESYRKLITLCWSENASKRPSFESIVEMLKNDGGFITEKVNEGQYKSYINYINGCKVTFDNSLRNYEKIIEKNLKNSLTLTKFFSIKNNFFSFEDFNKLDDSCKVIIENAGNDPECLFMIGKYLVEGQLLFERNTMIGIMYLEESMKLEFIESAIYFCRILIEGKIIYQNKSQKNS